MDFSSNGTVLTSPPLQISPGTLGVTMNQYESLTQMLIQLQESVSRLSEKESEKAAFTAETRLRLQAIEKAVAEHTVEMKAATILSERHREELRRCLGDLQNKTDQFPTLIKEHERKQDALHDEIRQEVFAKISEIEKLPAEIKQQWKGVTTFVGIILTILGVGWSLLQTAYWIYEKF